MFTNGIYVLVTCLERKRTQLHQTSSEEWMKNINIYRSSFIKTKKIFPTSITRTNDVG